jgi:hypothetical protein
MGATIPDMIIPHDRKTRIAVQGTYVRQALEALRRAIVLEDDDTWRADLTTAAATLAVKQRRADQQYADIRHSEAAMAAAALES